MKWIAAVLVLMAVVGCSESGTWRDDPRNWSRVFGGTQPSDIVIVHSEYWRSAHFTYEYEYFFHIQANRKLRDHLVETNKLQQVSGPGVAEATQDYFSKKPAWFLPKPEAQYEVWRFENHERNHFRLFIDTENGDIFITDFQV